MGGSKLMLMRQSMSRNKKQGNVACMEVEAMLLGFQSAQQAYCFPLILESDSKEVVKLALSKKSSKGEISWRTAEIQEKMKVKTSASITYVSRSCNSITHYLAKATLDFDKQVIWLGNFLE